MEKCLKIPKSIIKKLFYYYDRYTLDDEEELFPILKKIIIKGTLNSVKDKMQKNEIEAELKEFSKELYIKYWIKTAKEDTVQINIEHETKMAKKIFEKIYKKS